MKKMKMLSLLAALLLLLTACGGPAPSETTEAAAPPMTLSSEDQELLEALGPDLVVVAPADFAATVPTLAESSIGMVYQFTGTYRAGQDGSPSVTDDAGTVSLGLNMMTRELNDGEQYTITGVISGQSHDGHVHLMLDVLTVASYTGS